MLQGVVTAVFLIVASNESLVPSKGKGTCAAEKFDEFHPALFGCVIHNNVSGIFLLERVATRSVVGENGFLFSGCQSIEQIAQEIDPLLIGG